MSLRGPGIRLKEDIVAQLQRTIVNTDKAPQPIGAYSQAIRTAPGELLFMAGQVAVDSDGNLVGPGDMVAQTRQVFQNLGGVLAGVGASFSNVVEFTTYVVGRGVDTGVHRGPHRDLPHHLPRL